MDGGWSFVGLRVNEAAGLSAEFGRVRGRKRKKGPTHGMGLLEGRRQTTTEKRIERREEASVTHRMNWGGPLVCAQSAPAFCEPCISATLWLPNIWTAAGFVAQPCERPWTRTDFLFLS